MSPFCHSDSVTPARDTNVRDTQGLRALLGATRLPEVFFRRTPPPPLDGGVRRKKTSAIPLPGPYCPPAALYHAATAGAARPWLSIPRRFTAQTFRSDYAVPRVPEVDTAVEPLLHLDRRAGQARAA